MDLTVDDNLPKISEILRDFNIVTTKKLGQNFLFDKNITDKIIRYTGNIENKEIIEIGPGPGLLSRSILSSNPKKLSAIEADERCVNALKAYLLPRYPEQLNIIHGDALKEFGYLTSDAKVTIISNLPYNISTTLLFKWLDNTKHIAKMTLMFQKEVADRICANPKSKQYGWLSIKSQLLCQVSKCFEIPPEAFYPPPKITSTVINLTPYEQPKYPVDLQKLEKLCKAAFSMRRKTLRQSLKSIIPDPIAFLGQHGIDSSCRAEELSIEQFCKLSLSL